MSSSLANSAFEVKWTPLTSRIVTGAALCVAVASFVMRLPIIASLQVFGFADPGSVLQTDLAIAEGYRPGIDFAYPYGLLTLAVSRGWFFLFGRTPASLVALLAVCQLLCAWGVVRFARARRMHKPALALLLASIPLLLASSTIGVCHCVESALLVHAMAEQAAEKRSRCLVLAGLAALVKPSMAFVYAAAVGALLVLRLWRRQLSSRRFWRTVSPGILVIVISTTLLVLVFGPREVLETALPLYGRKVYQANGFGFFAREGRNFWHPTGANVFYYLGTSAGFWLVVVTTTLTAGVAAAWRLLRFATDARVARAAETGTDDELLVTSATCQFVWIVLLFGGAWSSSYYLFFAVFGAALWINQTGASRPFPRLGAALAAVLAVLALKSEGSAAVVAWRTWERGPDTYGLWTPPAMREEWRYVQAIQGRRPVLGSLFMGGLEVLDRRFVTPRYGMLIVGASTPVMRRELERRIAAADLVLVEKFLLGPRSMHRTETESLESGRPVWQGASFVVLRH